MGQRTTDILAEEALIKGDGGGKPLHKTVGGLLEAATPDA